MTGTTRIRWEPVRRQNHNALVGHVGTAEKFRFRIWRSPWAIGGWQLGLALPGGGGLIYIAAGSDPDKLKPAAEAWFGEFIGSLGAVFPPGPYDFGDEDGEPLEVKYAAGRRVRYAHPENGYPGELQAVEEALTLGEVYTIAWADIGQSRTDLNLYRGVTLTQEVIGRFNSVFFELVDDQEAAPAAAGERED